MFVESVDKLVEWMYAHDSNKDLVVSLQQYLCTRGEGSMLEIVHGKDYLHSWATQHDILGWDNFLEGRIGHQVFELQRKHLQHIQSRRKIKSWAVQFIQQVLRITHQQWLYRNTKIHIRQVEGKTASEHLEIMQAVRERLDYEVTDLLPQHRHLLHQDLIQLGSGPTIDRQYWVAQMDSAIAAASRVQTETQPT